MEQPSTQPLPAPLYSYLKMCTLEKRGQHRLSDIDFENERDGCSDDMAFLMQFVDDIRTVCLAKPTPTIKTERTKSVCSVAVVEATRSMQQHGGT